MDFHDGLQRMVENISAFENGNVGLHRLKENLFGLYEFIDGRRNGEFADRFHEYWDFLEEICAVNGEVKYREKIESYIIPEMKRFLLEEMKKQP